MRHAYISTCALATNLPNVRLTHNNGGLVMLRYILALMLVATAGAALAAPVPPPQSIVVISCRVDDLTGQAGRQDPELAARGWRDLEWHYSGGEIDCKREEIALTDSVTLVAPETPELHPNFGDYAQCAAVAMQVTPNYERANHGWAVMAVGCPTKIVNDQGEIVGWHMPECPSWVRCRFSGNEI